MYLLHYSVSNKNWTRKIRKSNPSKARFNASNKQTNQSCRTPMRGYKRCWETKKSSRLTEECTAMSKTICRRKRKTSAKEYHNFYLDFKSVVAITVASKQTGNLYACEFMRKLLFDVTETEIVIAKIQEISWKWRNRAVKPIQQIQKDLVHPKKFHQ